MKALVFGVAALVLGGAAAATVGQVGRDSAPQLDRLPAWAGGRPDVAICEQTFRDDGGSIEARRTRVAIVDSAPLSPAAFDAAAGIAPPTPPRRGKSKFDQAVAPLERLEAVKAELDRDRLKGHELRLRRMAITYDDGAAVCAFRLVDGKLEDPDTLRTRLDRQAGMTSLDAAAAYLGERGIVRATPSTRCCL